MSKTMNDRQGRMGLWMACCCLMLAANVTCAASAGQDPLETPAPRSDKASTALLLDVAAADSRLVAVGEHGIIVYSDDEGKNWRQADVPVSVTLTAVQFINARSGWTVGHDGVVLSSVDAGQTWQKRFDGNQANRLILAEAEKNAVDAHRAADGSIGASKAAALKLRQDADNALADAQAGAKFGPSRPLLGVAFKDEREGFVVGAYGQIFHTADGGDHWESLVGRMQNPDGLHFNAIAQTPGGSLVIAGEGGKVYRSRDGGIHWQALTSGYAGQLYGVLGISDAGGKESLEAFGFGGHVMLSVDDGKTWQQLPPVISKNLVRGVQLAGGSIVLAAQDGSLLRSEDRGNRYSKTLPGNGSEIAGMALLKGAEQVAVSGVGGVRILSLSTTRKMN